MTKPITDSLTASYTLAQERAQRIEDAKTDFAQVIEVVRRIRELHLEPSEAVQSVLNTRALDLIRVQGKPLS